MNVEKQFMKINLHSHTYRCNHAAGTEREYVEKAIKAGIKVLGFSDHTPQVYGNRYVSGIRMKISDVPGYAEVINGLKKEYEKDIQIFLGFEVEYYPDCFERLCRAITDIDYDYFILAQHFTNNEYDGKYVGGSCNRENLELYTDAICHALDLDCFTYLAHPDLPPFMGDSEEYLAQMMKICNKAKEKDIPLEINLLGMATGRIYPRREFWKLAAQVGNKAILGLDAHQPSDFDNVDVYKRAVKFANEVGVVLTEDVVLKSPKGEKKIVLN